MWITVAISAGLQDRDQFFARDTIKSLLFQTRFARAGLDALALTGQTGKRRRDSKRNRPLRHAAVIAVPGLRSCRQPKTASSLGAVTISEQEKAILLALFPLEKEHQKQSNESNACNTTYHATDNGTLRGGCEAGRGWGRRFRGCSWRGWRWRRDTSVTTDDFGWNDKDRTQG